jgi:hypothetical protein
VLVNPLILLTVKVGELYCWSKVKLNVLK